MFFFCLFIDFYRLEKSLRYDSIKEKLDYLSTHFKSGAVREDSESMLSIFNTRITNLGILRPTKEKPTSFRRKDEIKTSNNLLFGKLASLFDFILLGMCLTDFELEEVNMSWKAPNLTKKERMAIREATKNKVEYGYFENQINQWKSATNKNREDSTADFCKSQNIFMEKTSTKKLKKFFFQIFKIFTFSKAMTFWLA